MQSTGSYAIGELGMSDDAGEAGASLEGIGGGLGGQVYAFGGLGMTGTPESFDTSDERTAGFAPRANGAGTAPARRLAPFGGHPSLSIRVESRVVRVVHEWGGHGSWRWPSNAPLTERGGHARFTLVTRSIHTSIHVSLARALARGSPSKASTWARRRRLRSPRLDFASARTSRKA
jgi:hypothetical protein